MHIEQLMKECIQNEMFTEAGELLNIILEGIEKYLTNPEIKKDFLKIIQDYQTFLRNEIMKSSVDILIFSIDGKSYLKEKFQIYGKEDKKNVEEIIDIISTNTNNIIRTLQNRKEHNKQTYINAINLMLNQIKKEITL